MYTTTQFRPFVIYDRLEPMRAQAANFVTSRKAKKSREQNRASERAKQLKKTDLNKGWKTANSGQPDPNQTTASVKNKKDG